MRSINVTLVLALIFAASAPAVAADVDYPLIGQSPVYTLVNLHPDEPRQRLYSVNYQQQGLIPLCTKVKLESLDKRKLTFRVLGKDREYEYVFHNSLRDPIAKHLDKVFGKKCDKASVEKMSEVDRKGIRAGTVLPGMSKRGVTLALGYPPEHATPSLDSDVWTYWKNRFGKLKVTFANGKVSEISD